MIAKHGWRSVSASAAGEWALLAAAGLAAIALWNERGREADLRPGETIRESITLVTADRHDLSCAFPRPVQGNRCEFSVPDEPSIPPVEPASTLVPYMTTDRSLYLIAGLFEVPEVEARYRMEPPAGKKRDRLRRFVAYCELELLEKLSGFFTRWGRRSGWNRERSAWVARPLGCRVED